MDLPIVPPNWGSLKVFDLISYISFFVLCKDFNSYKKKHLIYHIIFCALILVLLLGSLNSDFISNSLLRILSIFPIFIYSKLMINECYGDTVFQKKVIQSLKFAVLLSIVFLVIQIIVGLKFSFYVELNRNTLNIHGIRYPSFFHDPQKYQQFLVLLSFIFLINDKNIRQPNFKNYILFFVIVVAMLTTGGRSAMIGLWAGLILLFFVLGQRHRIIMFVSLVTIGIIVVNFSDSLLIFQRSENFSNDIDFRYILWQEAFNIYKDHPIFGIGLGNYENYSFNISQVWYISAENDVVFLGGPESGYMTILSETGTLGFIISFLFILTPIFSSVNGFLNGNRNLIIFIFISSILSWLVSFVSLDSLSDKRILIPVITFICLIISSNFTNPKFNDL